MTQRQLTGYRLLRIAVASIFLIHGLARIGLGIVDDFSAYWQATFGVSHRVGLVASWTVTLLELILGTMLALGRRVWPISIWFIAQLSVGIVTIHAKAGWFVVGAGRNGMEYSVLVIVCLVVLLLLEPRRA